MNKTEQQQQVDKYFDEDQTKSLLLYGPNGVGKTTSMKEYIPKMWNATAIQFAAKISSEGRKVIEKYGMHDMYIDDLGRESIKVQNYTDAIEPLHDLLHFRYEVYQRTGYKTHISTNLDFKELEERYGVAISDRIKEMCGYIVEFKGDSLRK